ncbi:Serpentine receptor class epsilon-21 [Caenorhabditis elegans]|uniref:Serpentine receptor class epsilon-21 n=1 Tax=Caenorhabditis elegans TaxID=6239 RepID=SRE21_CAEEL|nr:Serpentine receptor class epsilon-21 [Caenorhabditis elegans]O45306.2 RecName: Full=Serpentine receptor class epsilon-21; Short=Protein sre-21 [Caenorhabditis elegans]CAB03969.2 Serpentine receptor class epsilon-21 [Caenorhabditis elegans]|eukprot:NP_507490.2 Serpentine receptor class epsilon-21 [Caenorhabditis elegans]
MNFQFLAIFSVRLATKEEVLDRTQESGDVNVVWVFTYNSNREFSVFEFILINFLFLLSIFVTFIGVFCIGKSNIPHRNARWIIISGMLLWLELVVSRSFVFIFQWSSDGLQSRSGLLFWAALLRYHYMFFGVHTLLCITAERAMATILLKDYETRPRVWIAAILIGANFLISLTYAFLAVFQQILMKSIFIVCLAVAVVSIILLEIIYFLNRKRLDSLIRHDNTMVLYTLSIKYQLQENVRSCRLMRPAVVVVGAFIIMLILAECLPIILDFSDEVQMWCNLIFDTTVHTDPLVVVPTVVALMESFRKVFLSYYRTLQHKIRPNTVAVIRRKSIFPFTKPKETEGDIYFEMFNKSVSPNSLAVKK